MTPPDVQSRLTATEQVCLEAIQERDRALAKLERVEGERDAWKARAWTAEGKLREIGLRVVDEAISARQMTLEDTKGGGVHQ